MSEHRCRVESSRVARRSVALLVLVSALGCASPRPPERAIEATSFLGEPLRRPALSSETEREFLAKLDAAREVYERNPNDAEAVIWLGRRTAYLGRYNDAIAIFTEGIRKHPDDARLYRHRGHRYLTIRRIDIAIRDLERAADLERGEPDEIEPDGLPNARNIPTSTLQFNIWYHLGLARYLDRDFEGALGAWRECLAVSKNPDAIVATSHWLHTVLCRLDRREEARAVVEPIHSDLDIIENDGYHRLTLVYRGDVPAEDLLPESWDGVEASTIGYGLASWYRCQGDVDRANEILRSIASGNSWAAFGFIAAEADLGLSGGE